MMPSWSGTGSSTSSARPTSTELDRRFVRTYRKHHTELVRLATVLVGDRHDGTEVAHEAFRRLHRDWDDLPTPRRELEHLRAIVLALSRRFDPTRPPSSSEAAPLGASTGPAPDPASVRDALARLPYEQREVLVLRHLVGLSDAAVADHLGLSADAVRIHVERALEQLRDRLASP